MAEIAVSTVKSWLSKLNIKAPWKMVGVASSPEFQTHLPKATEYRVVAPASQKLRPSIPAAETDRIYDIRYWIRDDRRSGQLVNGTNKKHMVSYTVDLTENSPMNPDEPPPSLGQPHKWQRKNVSLLDNDAAEDCGDAVSQSYSCTAGYKSITMESLAVEERHRWDWRTSQKMQA